MMKHNVLHKIFTLFMVLSLLLQTAVMPEGTAYAAPKKTSSKDIIIIRTAEDLMELAEDCRLDTWSQGKKVVLERDISLHDVEFLPIPTFGGTFDGQGHKISALKLTDSVSPAGIFGVIQEGALVENLHVAGVVTPGGEQINAGGICGVNYGTIRSCSFQGMAAGEENIGGIAGINGLTGLVEDCRARGSATGEKRTGGICGYNLGTVSDCQNLCHVNTGSVNPALELEDFHSMEELIRTTAAETYNIAADTGGICGYSAGMILHCTNEGNIGYLHIGYNVGGIAGRSSGHISQCENKGPVYGRKDVGGIAGQMEPYIVLNVSSDWIQSLQKEMKKLNRMVNEAAEYLDETSAVLSVHMENLNSGIGTAGQLVHSLSAGLAQYGEDTITEINRTGEILQASAAQLAEISRSGAALGASLAYAMQQLEKATDDSAFTAAMGTAALKHLQDAVADLKKAEKKYTEGTELINQGAELLEASILKDGPEKDAALKTIREGLEKMGRGMEDASKAVKLLQAALKEGGLLDSAAFEAMKDVSSALNDQAKALIMMAGGVRNLMKQMHLDLDTMKEGIGSLKKGAAAFAESGQALDDALSDLSSVLDDTKAASGQLTAALGSMADAVHGFQGAAWSMTSLMREIEELFLYLSRVNPVQIGHMNQQTAMSAEALYGTFTGMQEEVGVLSSSLRTAASDLSGHIRSISNQFTVTMDTLLGAVYSLQEGGGEILEDTSEKDISSITSGKVCVSRNLGTVQADVNVGGITGTMAVESELDPEDDLEQLQSTGLQKTYELKCILERCENKGTVTARKNYAGGCCGKADLGLITGCENYGTIASETGSFVGGIAGVSSSAIRDSFAKSFLSGNSSVGGIAGALTEGSRGRIEDCCTMVEITSCRQYGGAICGREEGIFKGNCFVSEDLAGLNRVSMKGKAEPVSYKKMKKVENLPSEFLSFTLTFVNEEETVKTMRFAYGDSFTEKVFPELAEKEGHYGVWDRKTLENLRFDTVVTAEYLRHITALESSLKRKDGRPVFFAEGLFTEEDRLKAAADRDYDSAEEELAGAVENLLVTEVWDLEIPEDGQETHQIRYLKPDHVEGSVQISLMENGSWREADCEEIGSYVVFEADGNEVKIQAVSGVQSSRTWAAMTAGGIAAVLTVLLMIRKRRKHEQKTEAS